MIEPLFEHRGIFAGCATRVLELEGERPPLVFFHGDADSADDRLGPDLILPQLDEFAIAVLLLDFAAQRATM